MTEMATLAYGLLATFVMQSMHRNRRQARPNPAILTYFGWGLLAFSGALGVILLAYAGLKALGEIA